MNRKPAKRSIMGVIVFIFKEILYQRRWFLLPLWVLLAVIGLGLFILGSSSIMPAIYMIGF